MVYNTNTDTSCCSIRVLFATLCCVSIGAFIMIGVGVNILVMDNNRQALIDEWLKDINHFNLNDKPNIEGTSGFVYHQELTTNAPQYNLTFNKSAASSSSIQLSSRDSGDGIPKNILENISSYPITTTGERAFPYYYNSDTSSRNVIRITSSLTINGSSSSTSSNVIQLPPTYKYVDVYCDMRRCDQDYLVRKFCGLSQYYTALSSRSYRSSSSSCYRHDRCGICKVFLKEVCRPLKFDLGTNSWMIDTEYANCNGVLRSSSLSTSSSFSETISGEYEKAPISPTSSDNNNGEDGSFNFGKNITIRFISKYDPLLSLNRLTKGSLYFGISKEQQERIGKNLIIVGSVFVGLIIFGFCYFMYRSHEEAVAAAQMYGINDIHINARGGGGGGDTIQVIDHRGRIRRIPAPSHQLHQQQQHSQQRLRGGRRSRRNIRSSNNNSRRSQQQPSVIHSNGNGVMIFGYSDADQTEPHNEADDDDSDSDTYNSDEDSEEDVEEMNSITTNNNNTNASTNNQQQNVFDFTHQSSHNAMNNLGSFISQMLFGAAEDGTVATTTTTNSDASASAAAAATGTVVSPSDSSTTTTAAAGSRMSLRQQQEEYEKNSAPPTSIPLGYAIPNSTSNGSPANSNSSNNNGETSCDQNVEKIVVKSDE